VERKGEGAEGASELVRLIGAGWSVVVFAEGTRSRDGTVGRLRSGAALLAAEYGLPIVPVHVAGTHPVMPPGRSWPRRVEGRRQPIAIHFGPAIRPREGEHRTEVMERVRQFLEASGAATTPDKRVAARRAAAAG
jgi:1-acyl-sn-glycerol-3-phosphate acyltransferase